MPGRHVPAAERERRAHTMPGGAGAPGLRGAERRGAAGGGAGAGFELSGGPGAFSSLAGKPGCSVVLRLTPVAASLELQ